MPNSKTHVARPLITNFATGDSWCGASAVDGLLEVFEGAAGGADSQRTAPKLNAESHGLAPFKGTILEPFGLEDNLFGVDPSNESMAAGSRREPNEDPRGFYADLRIPF